MYLGLQYIRVALNVTVPVKRAKSLEANTNLSTHIDPLPDVHP